MIKINADGTLSLDAATLTTQQVEQLIIQLAKARAQMYPPVPQTPVADGATVLTQPDPGVMINRDWAGNVSLGLRHKGFGWVVFQLPPERATALRAILGRVLARDQQNTPDEDGSGGNFAQH